MAIQNPLGLRLKISTKVVLFLGGQREEFLQSCYLYSPSGKVTGSLEKVRRWEVNVTRFISLLSGSNFGDIKMIQKIKI